MILLKDWYIIYNSLCFMLLFTISKLSTFITFFLPKKSTRSGIESKFRIYWDFPFVKAKIISFKFVHYLKKMSTEAIDLDLREVPPYTAVLWNQFEQDPRIMYDLFERTIRPGGQTYQSDKVFDMSTAKLNIALR